MHRRTPTSLARLALGASLSLGAFAVGAPLPGSPAAPIASAAPVVPTSTVVYDSIDDPLPGNVPSQAFAATSTSEFGDAVQLAPGPRRLDSVTVTMSSWACESGGIWNDVACSTTPGATYTHPVTLNVYDFTGGTIGSEIATITQDVEVPYRPSAASDPSCPDAYRWKAADGTCNSGLAFPVTFDVSTTADLPEQIVWSVAFNTSNYGQSPLGTGTACYATPQGCAYDSLNVGVSQLAATLIGTDLDSDGAVLDSTWVGAYCDGGAGGSGTLRIDTSPGCWAGYRPMARIETTPPPSPTCEATGSTLVQRVTDFDDTVIRSSGRFEVVDGAAHVWTVDASSNAKVAGYVDAPGAKIGDAFEVVWSGTTPAPGAQIVLSDGSILVGEAVYGNDLWVPTNHPAAAYAPQTGGGFGSSKHGSPAEWQAAIEAQGVTVAQVGFSLGSGVLGDGVLTSVTAGCHTITFDEPPCAANMFDGYESRGGLWEITYGMQHTDTNGIPVFTNDSFGGLEQFNLGAIPSYMSGANYRWLYVYGDQDGRMWSWDFADGTRVTATASYTSEGCPQIAWNYLETPELCTTDCYVDAANGHDLNGGASPADAKKTIQAGVNSVDADGTVHVAAGTYGEDVSVNKAITIVGAGMDATTIVGQRGGDGATVRIASPGVRISGVEITRDGNTVSDWNDASLNSAGIAVQGQANDVHASQVRLTGNRTGIDVNNSDGNTVVDSEIVDNRTGAIFRNQTDQTAMTGNVIADNWTVGVLFLDASGGTNSPIQTAADSTFSGNSIHGNWYGGVVDRQTGGSLPSAGTNIKNFSGNWWGTTAPAVSTNESGEPVYAAQIPVAFGGTAAPPVAAAPDILGPASANVDFTPVLEVGTDTDVAVGFQGSTSALTVTDAGAQSGTSSRVQEGVDLVDADGTVHVAAGLYEMASPVEIDKAVSLLGPNAGISPNRADKPTFTNPARQAEATLAPGGGNQLIRIGAPGVVVDGFRFTDPATAGSSNVTLIGAGGNFGGQADGVEIANNVFWRISRIAVYTNGPTLMSGVDVHDNRVAGPTRADGCGTGAVADSACGHQLFNLWQAEDVDFVDNVVLAAHANGDRARVLSLNAPSTLDAANFRVAGNTIRNACVFTCFSIAAGVDEVRITGNDVDIDSGDIVGIHGTFVGGDVTIDHNEFVVDEGSSVKVEPTATNVSGLEARRNSMIAGGVNNATATKIDATCNWWGQASGPRSGQNFGQVDASKQLTSADLDGTCKKTPKPPKPPKPQPEPPKPPKPQPPKPGKADFEPITPTRLFDTRPGAADAQVSVPRTEVTPQRQLAVKVTGLPGGLVPASGVGAVSLNVTVDAPASAGWLAVVPCGSSKVTSSVNFDSGETTANAVLVAVPSDGKICFRSSTPLHVIVDINGWLPSAGEFRAVTPERVFDTRPGASAGLRSVSRRQVTAQQPLSVQITDLPGGVVPANGVGSVSLNVTIADAAEGGWLAVAPCGTSNQTSSVNFRAGTNRANAVFTPVGPDGRVCFTSNVPVHVIVDVNGWFGSAGDFRAVTPDRLFDTRLGSPDGLRNVARRQVAAMQPLAVMVTGLPGGVVPSSGVAAVSLNVTVADAAEGGWVSVAPCGSSNVTSNVNFRAGTNTANAVLVAVPTDGRICFTSSVAAHMVVDINGWFAD